MEQFLQVRRALVAETQIIIDMIEGAAAWLHGKGTDQWARPWPDRAARDARVLRGLEQGRTWLAEDSAGPVATITYRQHANPKLWTALEQGDRAAYVSRLVVARRAAGHEIGAKLIDWAGERARQEWDAQWIRVDVWTTNFALHRYYESRGFQFCRFCDDAEYPSAALFQKPTAGIVRPDTLCSEDETSAFPEGQARPSLALPE